MLVVEGNLFRILFLPAGEDFSTEPQASIAEDGPRLLLEGRTYLRVLTELWMLVSCSCGERLGG